MNRKCERCGRDLPIGTSPSVYGCTIGTGCADYTKDTKTIGQTLEEMYKQCAEICVNSGIQNDTTKGGPLHEWVKINLKYKPEHEYFIVFGISGSIADILAANEGYKSASDKAGRVLQEKINRGEL